MWNCSCFQKCIDKQFFTINKPKKIQTRYSNSLLCTKSEINEIKCKGRSVCKAPRGSFKIDTHVNIIHKQIPIKSIGQHLHSKKKIKTNNNITYKNHFRCLFCGGKKCQHENYLNNMTYAIKGLNCNLIDNSVYLGQRPSNILIRKYHLLQEFKNNNIGLIVNLQRQGEHPHCGPGEMDQSSGFKYSPSLFISEGIKVKLAGWHEMNEPDAWDFVLDVIKEIYYAVAYKKKKVYIHCHTGNSRSGIIMACYKMFKDKCTLNEAVNVIKSCRNKALQKKDQIKYCQLFEDYLISLREIFTTEHCDLRTFLKRQWDLDVLGPKLVSYIPILLYKCITKILSLKYSKHRAYCNNTIYKAMNGSLGLIDEVYIQIRTLMKQINLGLWEELDKCESAVILSELMFFWMDESVNACINPKRIAKIVGASLFQNNIDSILNGNCSNLNLITNIYTFCKKNLKTAEHEIIKFFSAFFEKVYPYNTTKSLHNSNKTTLLDSSNQLVIGNKTVLEVERKESKDDIEEYNRMLEKIAIFLVGFNIDILYNEELYLNNLQRNINNASYGDITVNSQYANSNSKLMNLRSTQCFEAIENSIYKIIDNMVKILEFFRIYLKISKASILQMTLTQNNKPNHSMKVGDSNQHHNFVYGDTQKLNLAFVSSDTNNNKIKEIDSITEDKNSIEGLSFWNIHNVSYDYDSPYLDSSSVDEDEIKDNVGDDNDAVDDDGIVKRVSIKPTKKGVLKIDYGGVINGQRNKSSKLNTVVYINSSRMQDVMATNGSPEHEQKIQSKDNAEKSFFLRKRTTSELKFFSRKSQGYNKGELNNQLSVNSTVCGKDDKCDNNNNINNNKGYVLNKIKNQNFILKYCRNTNVTQTIQCVKEERCVPTPTFNIAFQPTIN